MTLSKFTATEALVMAVRNIVADFSTAEDRNQLGPSKLAVVDALDAYDAAVAAERKMLDETSRRITEQVARTLRLQSPSYRYFEHRGVRFCYNTSPVTADGGKWFAWEYRPVRGKPGRLAMKHKVKCGTRTKAKAKAYEWYLKAKEMRGR